MYLLVVINYLEAMTASLTLFYRSLIRMVMVRWRQTLLKIGWDGLQRLRTNPDTGKGFKPEGSSSSA